MVYVRKLLALHTNSVPKDTAFRVDGPGLREKQTLQYRCDAILLGAGSRFVNTPFQHKTSV